VSSGDHVLHLKLVNASNHDQPLAVDLHGVTGVHAAKMNSLHAASYEATNSLHDPNFIHPVESAVSVSGGTWQHTVPALTIEVMDIPLR
jgi:alpha-N-arabinofuranosidase